MDILYRKASGAGSEAEGNGGGEGRPEPDLRSLFAELYLRSDGDVGQTLDWLRRLAEEAGLLDRDRTFEDILDELEQQGLIRRDRAIPEITARGRQTVRDSVFERVFRNLARGLPGGHETREKGRGAAEILPSTRSWEFGDPLSEVDLPGSVGNSLRRGLSEDPDLAEEDLEVRESESVSSCASVLMIDISHSMILYGEDRITPAKMVAISLSEYIRRRFPRDTLDVLAFGDEAKRVPVGEIAELSVGPFHTNTCDGLRMAQSILSRRRNANKRIFLVTDGKPSAVFDRGRLYRNSFGLDPLVLGRTLAEARRCRRAGIHVSTFMIARDPRLVEFVEEFTRACQGSAFFTGTDRLGEFIFVDYAENRRRRLRG